MRTPVKHLTGHLARDGNSTLRNVCHSPTLSIQPPSWWAPCPSVQSPGFTEEGTEIDTAEKRRAPDRGARGGRQPWNPGRPRPARTPAPGSGSCRGTGRCPLPSRGPQAPRGPGGAAPPAARPRRPLTARPGLRGSGARPPARRTASART